MVWSVFLTVLHLKTLLLIGCEFSTANQNPSNKWFLIATQRAKRSTPSERALKTDLKNSARLFTAFCLTYSKCMANSDNPVFLWSLHSPFIILEQIHKPELRSRWDFIYIILKTAFSDFLQYRCEMDIAFSFNFYY